MTKWIPYVNGFIEADVIRWKDRPRRERRRPYGHREEAEGWVDVLVRLCAVVSEKPGRKVALLPSRSTPGRYWRRPAHPVTPSERVNVMLKGMLYCPPEMSVALPLVLVRSIKPATE